MTDPTPRTADERDDLVSAVLDGEADAAEVALVETDPELAGRLERLRGLADRVAGVPAPPAGLADRAVEAALAHLSAPASRPVAPAIDELAARRAARAKRMAPFLAAAAAVVVLTLGALAIGNLDSGTRSDNASAAPESPQADGDGGLDSAEAGAGSSADPVEAPAADSAELGSFSAEFVVATDLDEFEGRVRDQLSTSAPGPASTTTAGLPTAEGSQRTTAKCAPAERSLATVPLLEGEGQLDRQSVTYAVFDTDQGRVLVVVDATCGLIAEIAL